MLIYSLLFEFWNIRAFGTFWMFSNRPEYTVFAPRYLQNGKLKEPSTTHQFSTLVYGP